MSTITLDYEPQPKQLLLHTTKARQVFYGGAAGGGKSHCMRWDLIAWCLQCPGIDVYLFRRSYKELEDNHIRKIQQELPREIGEYRESKKRFEFTNGSGINFCYCEREEDVKRYQGAEIHVLAIDEASHLTDYQINYLRGRVRLGNFKVPEEYRSKLPRIIMGSNPGGPGHNFLKQTFIDVAPRETIFFDKTLADPRDPESRGWETIFIPASMDDNIYIDGSYAGQFSGLPPELARALRDGDWDAVVGQALHNLSREKHMLRPFTPPRHWAHYMSIDWGTRAPFSVGWYVVVGESIVLKGQNGWPDRFLPEGAAIRYREYYGWNGHANKGCGLDSPAVGRKILAMELEREEPPMDLRVADNAMWARHDGPSVVERLSVDRMAFKPCRKDREANYAEFIARLAGNPEFKEDGIEEDHPMFFCTANCEHFWRTVPTLVLDPTDPEKGPETRKQEDHVYDEVAYLLSSRPFVITKEDRWYEENRDFISPSSDPYAMA